MSAAEVLAQALIPILGIYPANLKQEVAGEVAQKQLDALKAAGYAVVDVELLKRAAKLLGRWPTTAAPRRGNFALATELLAAADAAEAHS